MKTRYILFAFVLLALCSCAKQNESAGRLVTITAWTEEPEQSKTTVQDGGTRVYWEPGDAIKVFYGEDANRFDAQCTQLASVSSFTGSLNIIGGANEGAQFNSYIWGLYPFRNDATSDGESVSTTLPASQTGRAGGFAQNTNITLAHSTSLGLAFYNVCGGIRFTLSQPGIKRVVLEGNNEEALAGEVRLGFDGVPYVKEVTLKETAITLKAPDSGSFQTGVWYYIAALPGSFPGGFKLTFRSEEGSAVRNFSNSVSFKRGIFGSIENIDQGLDFSAGGGDDPNDVSIEIDGEFWDWANVPGVSSSGSVNCELKAVSNANYIYLYSKRSMARFNDIWGGSGYFYYGFDIDNDATNGESLWGNGPYDVVFVVYPFGGSSSAPEFNTDASSLKGTIVPSNYSVSNVICDGAVVSDGVQFELRIPRADLPAMPGTPITIKSWGNKDAGKLTLTCTL